MNKPDPNHKEQWTNKMNFTRIGNFHIGRAVCITTVIIFFFLYLVGCSGESSSNDAESKTPAETQTTRKTIVAVGDSLTAGLGVNETQAYPAQLQRKLADDGYDFKVVNAGVSGEMS